MRLTSSYHLVLTAVTNMFVPRFHLLAVQGYHWSYVIYHLSGVWWHNIFRTIHDVHNSNLRSLHVFLVFDCSYVDGTLLVSSLTYEMPSRRVLQGYLSWI